MQKYLFFFLFLIYLSDLTLAAVLTVESQSNTVLQSEKGYQTLVSGIQSNLKDVKKLSRERVNHIESSLVKYAEALGYYDAFAKPSYTKDKLTIKMKLGKRYFVRSVQYQFLKQTKFPWKEKRLVREGKPLKAQEVLDEVEHIKNFIERDNCYYRVQIQYKVKLDRNRKLANVIFKQLPSVPAVFGEVEFIGLKKTKSKIAKHYLLWNPGQCYKRSLVDKTINYLLSNQTFSEVAIREEAPSKKNPKVQIKVIVKEGKYRTIGASISSSTFNPIGVGFSFEHRNLTGQTDKLIIDSMFSLRMQNVKFKHVYPWLDNKSQVVTTQVQENREETEAYTASGHAFDMELSRKFLRGIQARIGVGYQNKRVKYPFNKDWYALSNVLFAVSQSTDFEKYPNNWRHTYWGFEFKPYWSMNDEDNIFYQGTLELKWTEPLGRRFNFSERFKYSQIDGESLTNIPTHMRLYAGGQASLRGYGYKELGTLYDRSRDGGEKLFEMSHELGYFVSQNWLARIFADAANIYPKPAPAPKLYWGTGVGISYIIGQTTVKADLAIPLTERHKIEKPFQFYISLAEVGS